MNVLSGYYTDKGNVKQINQDSLSLKVVNSTQGKIVFVVVCDGMGGLEYGELASREVVIAMNNWFAESFAKLVARDIFSANELFEQWKDVVEQMNERIGEYAISRGITMGTTLSALLIYKNHYYICHVGDSRVYAIEDKVTMLTTDHTLVAEEIRQGILTRQQAMADPRRNILLQCVGASDAVFPQFEMGEIQSDITFLVVSDGFVHNISDEELFLAFDPAQIDSKKQMELLCKGCVELVMDRKERDNITVVAVTVKQD